MSSWKPHSRKVKFTYPPPLQEAFERVTGQRPLKGVKLLTEAAAGFVGERFSSDEATAVQQLRTVVARVLAAPDNAVEALEGAQLLLAFWQLQQKAPVPVEGEMVRLGLVPEEETDLDSESDSDEEDTPVAGGGVDDNRRQPSGGRGTELPPPNMPRSARSPTTTSTSVSPAVTPVPAQPPRPTNDLLAVLESMREEQKAERAQQRAELSELRSEMAKLKNGGPRSNPAISENGNAPSSCRGEGSDAGSAASTTAPREAVLLDPAMWVDMDRTERAVLRVELERHFATPLTKAPHETAFLFEQLEDLMHGMGTGEVEDGFAVRLARKVVVRLIVLQTGYEMSWEAAQAVSDDYFGGPRKPEYLKQALAQRDKHRTKSRPQKQKSEKGERGYTTQEKGEKGAFRAKKASGGGKA
ncbi:hypothetical protein DIPPA_00805 [Diplonema papillatum]|nr:hypothetical protein DIPPA_25616 [Diplonema papillatum]KAJ9466240.1 hypothetical protein DIPPA_00805 [Diplonema papillatum]